MFGMKKKAVLLTLCGFALASTFIFCGSRRTFPYEFLGRFPIESRERMDDHVILHYRASISDVEAAAKAEFRYVGKPISELRTYLAPPVPSPQSVDCVQCHIFPGIDRMVFLSNDAGAFEFGWYAGYCEGRSIPGQCSISFYQPQSAFEKAIDRMRDWITS